MFKENYHYGSTKDLLEYCSTKPEWEYIETLYNEVKTRKQSLQIKSFERIVIMATQLLSRETIHHLKGFGLNNLTRITKTTVEDIKIPTQHTGKGKHFTQLFYSCKRIQILEGQRSTSLWLQRIAYIEFEENWETAMNNIHNWKDFNDAYKKQLKIDPLLRQKLLPNTTSNSEAESPTDSLLTANPQNTPAEENPPSTTTNTVAIIPSKAGKSKALSDTQLLNLEAKKLSKKEFAVRYFAKELGIEMGQQSTYLDLGRRWKGLQKQFGDRIIYLLPSTVHFPGGTTVTKTISLDGL